MDYSLLVAIEKKYNYQNLKAVNHTFLGDKTKGKEGKRLSKYQYLSANEEKIYHIAVIDYL